MRTRTNVVRLPVRKAPTLPPVDATADAIARRIEEPPPSPVRVAGGFEDTRFQKPYLPLPHKEADREVALPWVFPAIVILAVLVLGWFMLGALLDAIRLAAEVRATW